MGTSIVGVIQHYQRSIERCQNDMGRLLYCIEKLYKLPIKVEHLQETGIGKTVNSLRKLNGEIGVAAKALVTKWKAMVAAEDDPVDTNCQNDNNFNPTPDKESDDDDNEHKNQNRHNTNNPSKGSNKIPPAQDISEKPQSTLKNEIKYEEKSSSESKHNNETLLTSSSSIHNRTISNHSHTDENKNKHHKSHESRSKEKHHHSSHHSSQHKQKDKCKELEPTSSTSKERKGEKRHHSSKERSNQKHDKDKDKHRDKYKKSDKNSVLKNKEDKHHSEQNTEKEQKSLTKKSAKRDKNKHSPKPTTSTKATINSLSPPKLSTSTTPNDRKCVDSSESDTIDAKSTKPKISKEKKSLKRKQSTENNVADDGFDSTMGANFADVLGMLNKPAKKSKKLAFNNIKSPSTNTIEEKPSSSYKKSSSSNEKDKDNSGKFSRSNGLKLTPPSIQPELLSENVKLEPLDPSIALELPAITTNYKPRPLNQTVMDCVFNTNNSAASKRTLTDAEAMSHGISSKTIRTKIYSGVRTGQILQVPSLFDLCIRLLQKNIDAIEYTGGVPFEVLRSVLERATPQQLLIFEEYNPYLMEDSDELWKFHVQRTYRTQKRQEFESWRDMYIRCQEDQDRKLSVLASSIRQSQKEIAAPIRKTQMAFLDTMVKPPRSIQRKQEIFGTKSKLTATPAARVAALQSVTPNALKAGDTRLRVVAAVRDAAQVGPTTSTKPKKAPLMMKTLQFMRGRNKR